MPLPGHILTRQANAVSDTRMRVNAIVGMVSLRKHSRCLLLAGLALLLTGSLVVAGCAKGGEPSGQPAGPGAKGPPAAPVTTAQVVKRDVPVQIRLIGAAEPYSTVTIRSRVPGQLIKIAFTQGQQVKQGDLLFQIDPRSFEAALAAAKANLARDLAQAKNARDEAKFQEEIFKRNAGTQREYDRAIAAAEAAEAQVDADRAAVRNAEIQLGYTTITAPMDGLTGDLMVHVGSIVKADDTPMVTINQIEPIYLNFSAAERYLPQIRRYMASSDRPLAVQALLPETDEPIAEGALTFIDNQVDRTTGMINLKATFPNKDRQLWPGQFLNVALTLTTRRDAIVVPSQAVQTGQAGQYVFVVSADNKAHMRSVTAGLTWNDLTVIEKGDLQPGEIVVTEGQLRLTDGTQVLMKDAPASQPAPALAAGGPTK